MRQGRQRRLKSSERSSGRQRQYHEREAYGREGAYFLTEVLPVDRARL
jgi:hypothetical protein